MSVGISAHIFTCNITENCDAQKVNEAVKAIFAHVPPPNPLHG